MAVKFTKPEINIREKLSELDKPSGIAGEAMLRAETPQEQFNLIGAGRRNIVINGAQNVFQRGSSSVTINTLAEVFRADRFRYEQGGTTANNSAIVVSTDAPKGFLYSTQVTAGSSMSFISGGFTSLNYRGEGTDILGMKNGTSLGSVTLSFWVKCSRPGTYSLNFTTYNGSSERWYLSTYEIHSTEWEYKTITIPSDVSSNASQWFRLYWMLGGNSDSYTGTPGNWINGNGAYRGVSTQPLFNTSGATFKLTGVQLEVGRVATPFEHRSYGEELALCKRYFQKFGIGVPGYSNSSGSAISFAFRFTPEMRAQPTVSINNTTFAFADTFVSVKNASSPSISYNGFTQVSGSEVTGGELQITTGTNTTANNFQQLYSEDAIFFNSEL